MKKIILVLILILSFLHSKDHNLTQLISQSNLYMEQKNYKKAIESYKNYIEYFKIYYPNDTKYLAVPIFYIGMSYYFLKDDVNALKYLKKALILQKKHNIPQINMLIKAYVSLGNIYMNMHKKDKAMNFYLKAIKIQKEQLGKVNKELLINYNELINLYGNEKKYQKVILYSQKVLPFLTDDEMLSDRYLNIAYCYVILRQYSNALQYIKKSIQFSQKNNQELIVRYYHLAGIYDKLHNVEYTIKYLKKMIDLAKIENDSNLKGGYYYLGKIYFRQEAYQKSIDYFKKTLKLYSKDNYEVLGDIYYYLQRSYTRLYLKRERNQGVIKLKNLRHSKNKQDLINYLESNPYLKEARKYSRLQNELPAKEVEYHNQFDSNSSNVFETLNKYYEEYDSDKVNVLVDKTPRERLSYLNNLANSHFQAGELGKGDYFYEMTLPFAKKALNLVQKIAPNNIDNLIDLNYMLAMSYYHLDKTEIAYEYITKAYNLFRDHRVNTFSVLSSKMKENYMSQNKKYFEDFLLISSKYKEDLIDQNSSSQFLYDTVISMWLDYKGYMSEDQNLLTHIASKDDLKTQKDIQKLIELTRELANLEKEYRSYPQKMTQIGKKINKLKEEIDEIQIRLNQNSKEFKKLHKLEKISIDDMIFMLKTDDVYIDFLYTKHGYFVINFAATLRSEFFKNFPLQTSYKFFHIPYDKSQKINQKIKNFRLINQKIVNKNLVGTTKVNHLIVDSQKDLSDLYTLLSMEQLIEIKTSVVISPDGLLNFLPFEALYHDNKYLIETIDIHYTPSARDFIKDKKYKNIEIIHNKDESNQSNEKIDYYFDTIEEFNQYIDTNKTPITNNVVIFAHPKYGEEENTSTHFVVIKGSQTQKRRLIDIPYLAPLQGALEEIEIIKKFEPHATIFQDANATVENLLQIHSPKILHISTHGVFLDNNGSNPMLQSALAFAGTDRARMYKDTSGFATALKLSTLNLANTDLVVLSACDTGIGKINQAEGVAGLPKAFIQAGAQNIVMSLWKVSDKETTTLMEYFYDNIAKGMEYKEALREAKLKMIKMHPYYWSSFVLSGV